MSPDQIKELLKGADTLKAKSEILKAATAHFDHFEEGIAISCAMLTLVNLVAHELREVDPETYYKWKHGAERFVRLSGEAVPKLKKAMEHLK